MSRAHPVPRVPAWAALAAGLFGLLRPGVAAAQGAGGSWQIGGGASFELYSFSESEEAGVETISLLTLPFGARANLGSGLDLSVEGAWARGTVTRPARDDLTLSGPTDTEVRLGWGLADGSLRIEVAGIAPTGAATHDDEEAVVAGAVAADLLPFRISHWGAAGGVVTSVSAARTWGSFGAGVSVSYRLSDEFDPVEGEDFTYQPGDEFRVRLATDFTVAGSQKLSLAVGVRTYAEDRANDNNLFQTGNRIEGIASYTFPVALRSAGALYGGLVRREEGSFLTSPGEEVPSQDLILLGGLVRLPLAGGFITPRADARFFRPGGGVGEGFVIALGSSLELPLDDSVTLRPSLAGRFGSVDIRPESDSGFVGLQATLTLDFGPGTP